MLYAIDIHYIQSYIIYTYMCVLSITKCDIYDICR